MFVQLSVAGIVLLVAITSIFLPEEVSQRTEEITSTNQEDIQTDFSETITFWKKALDSLDITLGLSAGLGTILTAILSYRFSQRRWRGWGIKFQNWLWKQRENKKEVTIIMEPQHMSDSSDSKEAIQFQLASDQLSTSSYSLEDTLGHSDVTCSNVEKSDSSSEKTDDEENCSLVETSETTEESVEQATEPACEYKSLEARILAVEGNLMRDIDSRMKIFEQQLEEFKVKMRNGRMADEQYQLHHSNMNENASISSTLEETPVMALCSQKSRCKLDQVKSMLRTSVTSRKFHQPKSNIQNALCELIPSESCSASPSKESLANVASKGDGYAMTRKSSDCGSELSGKRSIATSIEGRKTKLESKLCLGNKLGKSETTQSDVMDAPIRLTSSLSSNPKKVDTQIEKLSSISANVKRNTPRTTQQIRAILQQTNEKIAQRNKLKLLNKA